MFEVAYSTGEWDVRKLLNNITPDLLSYWIVFLSKKDRKLSRIDYQLGLITKGIFEQNSKKNYDLERYIIQFKTQQELDQEEETSALRTLAFYGSRMGNSETKTVKLSKEEMEEKERKREEFFKKMEKRYPDVKNAVL